MTEAFVLPRLPFPGRPFCTEAEIDAAAETLDVALSFEENQVIQGIIAGELASLPSRRNPQKYASTRLNALIGVVRQAHATPDED